MPAKIDLKAQIEAEMASPNFWDNQEKAQGVVARLSAVKSIIDPIEQVYVGAGDLSELFELAEEEGDQELLQSLEKDLAKLA